MGNWIQTYSGRSFDYVNLSPRNVRIQDIAHALAQLCRFGGHVKKFYSVAQHSVLVSRHVPDRFKLIALLHDATEAYCVDIPRPLKNLLPEYKVIERKVALVVGRHFRLDLANLPKCVHTADNRALITERRDLLNRGKRRWKNRQLWGIEPYSERVVPLEPEAAEEQFLARYFLLAKSNFSS